MEVGVMIVRAVLVPVVFWILVLTVVRLAIVPPEACGNASPSEMRDAASEAARWIARNQSPDGRYTYEYNRDTETDLVGLQHRPSCRGDSVVVSGSRKSERHRSAG